MFSGKGTKESSLVPFPVFVLMKEQHDMERTIKQDMVPEGMALVETADGRWFPAFASLSEIPNRVYILDGSPLIPPALDSFHDPGQGYVCREEALEACHVWCEVAELIEVWRALAARTELYPERNAWYLDEIEQLAGDDTLQFRCGIPVHALVLARQTAGNDSVAVIDATGNTPDEAIETLYQHVYEWFCQQETIQRCASERIWP